MPSKIKYKAIAEQIISDIQHNRLLLGQRLPSLRQLTKQQGISMTTALNSYRSLEELGWVVTHPKSGFFVSTPFEYAGSPQQPQFRSSAKRLSKSPSLFTDLNQDAELGPFGISRLCPEDMPLTELKRSIKRTTQRGDQFLHSYPNPQGVSTLRRSISTHFSRSGFAISADELFISGGCMDAIRIALLATTNVGDAVAISSPCFNGLLNLLSNLDRKVVEIPCNPQGLDLQQLEARLINKEVKAALFSSCHMNPHGISLNVEQKQALAKMANKYRVPIIEDDIYAELGYDNSFPLPIKHWDSNGYVLWCSSVSKTLSSGLRIGWCSAGRYLNPCIDICATESLGNNGLMQASLADFISSGQYRKHLQNIRKTILVNARGYRRLLLDKLPRGSAVSAPNGGLVLWIQVPNLNGSRLKALSENAGFDLRFGTQFTSRKLYRDCFRLNLGWGLTAMHDAERSIEQALLELTNCVHESLHTEPQ